jgi:hypothetical protein
MARIEMPSAAIATVSPLPFQVTVKMIFPLFLVSLCTRHLTKSATGSTEFPLISQLRRSLDIHLVRPGCIALAFYQPSGSQQKRLSSCCCARSRAPGRSGLPG